MIKIIFTIFIALIASDTFAVCNSVAIDNNSRIISLAKDFADQADFEFKKANTLRGCELLNVSRSFISQSDNQKLNNQISNRYGKRCSKITVQKI
jgi:hypothetical protein